MTSSNHRESVTDVETVPPAIATSIDAIGWNVRGPVAALDADSHRTNGPRGWRRA